MINEHEFSAKIIEAFNKTGLPQLFQASTTSNGLEILMYDIIGSPECNGKVFAETLDAAAGAPLTIRLSSPGGNVFVGWEMYNTLKNYSGDSTVIVDGVCASIASIVALGADHVLTQDTSLWMIHNAWLGTTGNANELRDSADILDKIDANLRDIYAAKTGKAPEVWAEYMSAETWFSSSEAVAIGLVDKIAEAQPKAAVTIQPLNADTINEIRESLQLEHVGQLFRSIQADKMKMERALRVRRAKIQALR